MTEKIDMKYLDRRTVERHIKRGKLSAKDYEKWQKALPDLAEQAVPVDVQLESVEIVPRR